MEILHHTQREEKGEDLEPVSVFPLVGQHLLDNDDIRTAQTRATLKRCNRSWTCTESACPIPLDAKSIQWQTWETQDFLEGLEPQPGFISFLVDTIWVSAVNYLQMHFCCMQWTEFPIRLLQV